jgi:phage terminase large subunit-like protein
MIDLPDDWRQWSAKDQEALLTKLQEIQQERESGKVLWLCSKPGCDGSPHKGRTGRHARQSQRPPEGDWDTWLLLAGRGFGKSRTGAEWAWRQAKDLERGALVGPTAADTRDILVEGESGILASAPAAFRPLYEPSKRRLTYPNGAIQTLYSADEPDRLRGPQHHYFWADELASWRRLQYAWDMLQMGMRLGDHPRGVVTTTPRPLPLVKQLVKDERTHTVRGSTYDNLDNLAPTFRRAVVERYEGTTLGRQELHADILDDLPGALVSRETIEAARVDAAPEEFDLVVVGLDPAGTGTGDNAGIVAAGRSNGEDYILADVSAQLSAKGTADRAWALFDDVNADLLVYEDNFGKQWLEDVLRRSWQDRGGDGTPPMRRVTAQHGKMLRAQPVAMRYEQGKVHHVGTHGPLEDELSTWLPEESPHSPDRIDAMVHAVTHLMKRDRSMATVVMPHSRGLGRARGIGRTA